MCARPRARSRRGDGGTRYRLGPTLGRRAKRSSKGWPPPRRVRRRWVLHRTSLRVSSLRVSTHQTDTRIPSLTAPPPFDRIPLLSQVPSARELRALGASALASVPSFLVGREGFGSVRRGPLGRARGRSVRHRPDHARRGGGVRRARVRDETPARLGPEPPRDGHASRRVPGGDRETRGVREGRIDLRFVRPGRGRVDVPGPALLAVRDGPRRVGQRGGGGGRHGDPGGASRAENRRDARGGCRSRRAEDPARTPPPPSFSSRPGPRRLRKPRAPRTRSARRARRRRPRQSAHANSEALAGPRRTRSPRRRRARDFGGARNRPPRRATAARAGGPGVRHRRVRHRRRRVRGPWTSPSSPWTRNPSSRTRTRSRRSFRPSWGPAGVLAHAGRAEAKRVVDSGGRRRPEAAIADQSHAPCAHGLSASRRGAELRRRRGAQSRRRWPRDDRGRRSRRRDEKRNGDKRFGARRRLRCSRLELPGLCDRYMRAVEARLATGPALSLPRAVDLGARDGGERVGPGEDPLGRRARRRARRERRRPAPAPRQTRRVAPQTKRRRRRPGRVCREGGGRRARRRERGGSDRPPRLATLVAQEGAAARAPPPLRNWRFGAEAPPKSTCPRRRPRRSACWPRGGAAARGPSRALARELRPARVARREPTATIARVLTVPDAVADGAAAPRRAGFSGGSSDAHRTRAPITRETCFNLLVLFATGAGALREAARPARWSRARCSTR